MLTCKIGKQSNAMAAATQTITSRPVQCVIRTSLEADNDQSSTRVTLFCAKTNFFGHVLVVFVSKYFNASERSAEAVI